MKTYVWNDLSEAERERVLARPEGRTDAALVMSVRAIVDDVRSRDWDALVEHARRLDGAEPRRVEVAPIAAKARSTLGAAEVEA
ncbi:hypothetical protein NL438_26235, partial [Klebsiella pneumoniae]|nr:hypothetical protein [Klebsiella pneumoniae]